jgi:hypothetical protein
MVMPHPRRAIPTARVSAWAIGFRSSGRLISAERCSRINRQDSNLPAWDWTPNSTRWEDSFHRLQKYTNENGNACPPQTFEDIDGYRLGTWVNLQRQLEAKGTLRPELRDRLQALPGWQWTPRAALWEEGFRRVEEYVRKNGHASPPQTYVCDDGYRLGSWVRQQRQRYANDALSPDRRERLSTVQGWEWTPPRGAPVRHR